MTSILRRILCQATLLACTLGGAGPAGAEPRNGWWWNANESGRGFFIEMTGGVIYLGGYFYDDSGRATWLTSGGVVTDPYRYSGTLQSYRNGETLFGGYHAPDPAVDVGPVVVEFADDEHGSITWPGGTIPIERQIFGAGFPPFQPGSGWYWDEAASGTGFSVEVQGTNAFVVTFMYDDSGNPIWYYTAGPMASPTHYEGDLLLFSGGQTLTGPYRPPQTPTVVGRAVIDFTATDEADITFADAAASTLATSVEVKRAKRKHTKRQFRPRNWTLEAQWPRWQGKITRLSDQTIESLYQKVEVYIDNVVFVRDAAASNPLSAVYRLASGVSARVVFHQYESDSGCNTDGEKTFPVDDGALRITMSASYAGEFSGSGGAPQVVPFLVTIACPGAPPQTYELPYVFRAMDFGSSGQTGSFGGGNGEFEIKNFYPHCAHIRSYLPQIKGYHLVDEPSFHDLVWWRFTADYDNPGTYCD